MSDYQNKSDTSFTNKDFNEVYPELLELARDLSYKWDPTVSNESDPGVTLIKEIALALDKINYSSDKNALEAMPLSVTQERTARQLFQLLGYYPKWYISAEAEVSLAWKVSEENQQTPPRQIKIPAFTQLADSTGDYVYTLTEDIVLDDTGDVQKHKAIQGILKTLEINNQTLIKLDLIDKNNRVYFPDYNIAQNGIFIYSKTAQDNLAINERTFWVQKDNLLIEESGNNFYSFNVDIASGRCYVEFPTDISDLIGDGLYIKYLISTGRDGVIGIGQLNSLYDSTINVNIVDSDESLSISTEDLYIQNTDLIETGKNPESIDSMYVNYNHIKGTFDTLVTLKDYNNAVFNTKEVSNAVVCDRTNDVQESYRIKMQSLDDSSSKIYYAQNGENNLSAFNLKIYALQYNDLTETDSVEINKAAYDNTFEMYTDLNCENPFIDSSLRNLTLLLNDDKCAQHDFSNIEPNKICLLKNVAEISLTVFPKISLTTLQKKDLVNDIKNQIYLKYNARQLRFGEEIGYDDLFTNILTSSNFIKNISLNQIQYYTYALYYSKGEKYLVNALTDREEEITLQDRWRQVCISDEIDYVHMTPESDSEGFVIVQNSGSQKWFDARLGWEGVEGDLYGQNTSISSQYANNRIYLIDNPDNSGLVYYLNEDNRVVLYSTRRNDFRKEVLEKNILAGITPLFTVKKNGFEYQLDESDHQVSSVQNIDIRTQMQFDFDNTSTATYYPKDNEVVQLVKPQLSSAVTYGAYIRYDYAGETIPANSDYKLQSNDTLVIYYKTEDGEGTPYTRVIYEGGEDGQVVSPNFELRRTTDSIIYLTDPSQTPHTTQICNASQQISIKEINKVVLDSTMNYIYVLGEEKDGYYVLDLIGEPIEPGEETRTYNITLQGTQQFIYSSAQKTYLNIVGSGTKISVEIPLTDSASQKDTYRIKNEVISSRNISLYGVQALDKKWAKSNYKITILAQDFVNVIGTATDEGQNSDSYVTLKCDGALTTTVTIDRDGIHYDENQIFSNAADDKNYQGVRNCSGSISYTDDNSNDRTQDVANISKDGLFDFVNGDYDQSIYNSYIEQITLTSAEYEEKELSGVYSEGVGPSTKSGIVTNYFKTDTNIADSYYLINGATLYIVQDKYQNGVVVGHAMQQIKGFADALNGPRDTRIPSTSFHYDGYNGGEFHYSCSTQLPAGATLYLVNEITDPDSPYYAQIGNKIFGDILTNTGNAPISIEFSNPVRMHETAGGTFLYTGYILNEYYRIDDITFDYNTSAAGAYPYSDPSLADYNTDQRPPEPAESNNENGHPRGYITINATEVASNRVITFPLLEEFWEYASHKFAQDYYGQPSYVPTRDDFASTTPTVVVRKWEYQDVDGNTNYILDSDLRDNIFDYTQVQLIDRNLNNWVWPIQNYSIKFTAQQDFVTPDWNEDYTYSQGDIVSYSGVSWSSSTDRNAGQVPGISSDWTREESVQVAGLSRRDFTIIYKNRGDSEESEIKLNDDSSIGWSVYGLAFLDYQDGNPVQLYENQQVTLIVPDGKEEIQVTKNPGGVGGDLHLQIDGYTFNADTGLYELTDTFVDDNFDYIYSYCSDDLYIEGLSELQSTKLVGEDNKEYYPSILISAFDKDDDYSKEVQDKKIITFTDEISPDDQEGNTPVPPKQLEIILPTSSQYIFEVKNYQDLQRFEVEFVDSDDQPIRTTNIKCLNTGFIEGSNSVWDLKEKGVYFFFVNSISYFKTNIRIKKVEEIITSDFTNDQINSVGNDSIRVEIYPTEMLDSTKYSISLDSILPDIQELAKVDGRDAFDYFNRPAEDKQILNPLESTSFNNPNHFYNPYTICKIRTYDVLNDSNIFINS